MANMKEYCLLLITNQPITNNDYLSNKHYITGGDLIYLDGLTYRFEDAQEIGDAANHTNQKFYFNNAILIPQNDYFKLTKKEIKYPTKEEKVIFYKHRELVHKLFETGENPNDYINVLIEEYKNYLWNHKKEIENSLIRYVKIPEVTINASITYEDLEKAIYAYYYSKDISYKKIRDTYLELTKFYPNKLEQGPNREKWNI